MQGHDAQCPLPDLQVLDRKRAAGDGEGPLEGGHAAVGCVTLVEAPHREKSIAANLSIIGMENTVINNIHCTIPVNISYIATIILAEVSLQYT